MRYGVGVNDSDYPIKNCPFYKRWCLMLARCYSPAVQKKQTTYIGCEVCEDWLTFSNFKSWMEKQDWKGKVLDKDLLGNGKLYSPETCAFILEKTNSFMTDRRNHRGEYPLGVHKHQGGKYQARCGDSSGKRVHLGTFNTPEDASRAYKKCKREVALKLSEEETDIRVRNALITYI